MKQVVFFVLSLLWTYAFSDTCRTPLGASSNCVSLYDCPQLLAAIQKRPLQDSVTTFLRQSHCGYDGDTPRVCCGPLPSQQVQPTTQQSPGASYDQGQIDPTFEEDSSAASRNQCGIDTNGDRIYGGELTELDEFPWMALLGYVTRTRSVTYQCGGVLINRRYVLTAAHCITGAIEKEVGRLSTVRLGEYDTQNSVDCIDNVCADPPQDIAVHSAHPNAGYSDSNKNRKDDIGLVRLAKRVNYSYYVMPICLVDNNVRLAVGNIVFVAGWGKTLNGRNSPVKQKLSLPIYSKRECADKYVNLGAELTDYQICAGGVMNQDACRGDSGGPLMRRRPEGVWETVGVVSFGFGCGRDGWPGVYTSVAGYLGWISATLQLTNI